MIEKEVTFVIGAGAGVDVDMPVGFELALRIAADLRTNSTEFAQPAISNPVIGRALNGRSSRNISSMLEAAKKISQGVVWSKSIDDFLETHSSNGDVVTVGKLAIAHAILECERNSRLYVDPSNIYNTISSDKLRSSWLAQLARILYEGVKVEEVDHAFDYVTFINFNYDRCLEQFLTYSLKERFSLNTRRAHDIVSKARIFHPYGSLGKIGFLETQGGTRFGGNDSNDLNSIAQGIRIYSETSSLDENNLNEMKSTFEDAETLVFLGFAFHRQNCMMLQRHRPLSARQILGTAFGLSDHDISSVREWLVSSVDDPMSDHDEELQIDLKPLECSEFLQHYQILLRGDV